MDVTSYVHHMLAASPVVHGAQLGTAQVMTFAILLGTFNTLVVLILFWLRSGHERSRREALAEREREREESRWRGRVLVAHGLTRLPSEELHR